MPLTLHPRRSRSCSLRRVFCFAAAVLLLSVIAPNVGMQRLVVINTSPSVAPGLYLRSCEPPSVGQLVDFRIPPAARDYVRGRTGKNGGDWYILKPIFAGPGDRVDTTGAWLVVNGRRVAPMPPETDGDGRRLPRWQADRVLHIGEFFVFSNCIPNSFDSRCYGPIHQEQISAVRRPLIAW